MVDNDSRQLLITLLDLLASDASKWLEAKAEVARREADLFDRAAKTFDCLVDCAAQAINQDGDA